MFEHCTNAGELYDMDKEGFPTLPLQTPPKNRMEHPIYYYYTGALGSAPEEGCTYSFDTYAGWLADQTDQVPEVVDGKLVWKSQFTFTSDSVFGYQGSIAGVYHMARYKQCNGGKKELIEVSCRSSNLGRLATGG